MIKKYFVFLFIYIYWFWFYDIFNVSTMYIYIYVVGTRESLETLLMLTSLNQAKHIKCTQECIFVQTI